MSTCSTKSTTGASELKDGEEPLEDADRQSTLKYKYSITNG